ncbi:MAG: branched-chain amino acid ABC transporter permease [Caldilineaceae bacterium]
MTGSSTRAVAIPSLRRGHVDRAAGRGGCVGGHLRRRRAPAHLHRHADQPDPGGRVAALFSTPACSFGHAAFVGIVSTVPSSFHDAQAKSLALRQLYPVLQNVHLPFLPSLLIGAAIATLLAAVVGFPPACLSGAAAVIATLSLLVIAHTVFINWEEVTNGARAPLRRAQRSTPRLNALAWALFFVLVAYWFKETATGLKLRASREEERAAAVMGVNIVRVRWVAWILSAFIVGVGGVLYAHFITSFSPVAFYLSQTFIIIAMLIIGGSGSVAGAVVGVVVVTLLTESLRAVENSVNMSQAVPFTVSGLSEMFVALAMILILIYRPAGIMRGREFVWPLLAGAQGE